jgi:hypothetical protein
MRSDDRTGGLPARGLRAEVKNREYLDFEPWFPIPHYFVDALAPILPGSHFKVLVFLFRKTLGWKKRSDFVSLSQIQAGAGVSRKVANQCLDVFQQAGIIGKRRGRRLRGTNQIFILPKVDPDQATSVLSTLVAKGKKGRLRVTRGTRTGSLSELRLVHRVNTQKESTERMDKDGGGAPSNSPVTQKAEAELGKAEFFREWARIAGKREMV